LLEGSIDPIERKLRDPVTAVAIRTEEMGGVDMHANRQFARSSGFN